MSVPNRFDVVQQMEAEGLFERARSGDKRGASLFARLAAYRMNPRGDRSGFGWLRKGGGTMVDGYSEDAIVYGDGPTTDNNVVDMVAGAGAPGASIAWQIKPRRIGVDVWEPPRDLTADEYAYLGGQPGTQPPPVVTPPVQPVCKADPQTLERLVGAVATLVNQVAHLRSEQAAAREDASEARKWAEEAAARASIAIDEARQVKARLDQPLPVQQPVRARFW